MFTFVTNIKSLVVGVLLAIFFTFGFGLSAQAQSEEEYNGEETLSREMLLVQYLELLQVFQELLAAYRGGEGTYNPDVTPSDSEVVEDDEQRAVTTERLRVRADASALSSVVGIVEAGTAGDVLDGPRRSGQYNWWQIAYDTGLTGWSAGDWLEFTEVDEEQDVDSWGIDDVRSITVQPIGQATYHFAPSQYQITLYDGNQLTLSVYSVEDREQKFRAAGYVGDINELSRMAVMVADDDDLRPADEEEDDDTTIANDDDLTTPDTDGGTDTDTNTDNDNGYVTQIGDFQVYIDLGQGTQVSIHQDMGVDKRDSQNYCAENMDGWLEQYADQYPGKIIACIWDDGEGDTAGQRDRIPGEADDDDSDTTENTVDPKYTSLVNHTFQCILGRSPDSAGKTYYEESLSSGAMSPSKFFREVFMSDEYIEMNTSNSRFVEQVYECIQFRSPQPSGKAYWIADLEERGMTRLSVINNTMLSPEFQGKDPYAEAVKKGY